MRQHNKNWAQINRHFTPENSQVVRLGVPQQYTH